VLPRIKNDFLDILIKTGKQQLDQVELLIDKRYAATVMLVSGGYPETYQKGYLIEGVGESAASSMFFHAGTLRHEGKPVTAGGRVMAVTCMANQLQEAFNLCYEKASTILFKDKYYRTDLGKDLAPYLVNSDR
jgi:phosphoribosylamine---glycine ligase